MTRQHFIELDLALLLGVSAVAGTVFAMYYGHKPNIRSSFSLPVITNLQTPSALIPTPTTAPTVDTFSQVSPDGTKTLTLTVTTQDDNKTYDFVTSDKTALYSTTLPSSDKMSIPFNTWSPDNKYVFLEQDTASGSAALVMKADGTPITNDEKMFNVEQLFANKDNVNTYQETTGWASETLLIVNTTHDGSKGPSYWLEVPSKAIMQLSTLF